MVFLGVSTALQGHPKIINMIASDITERMNHAAIYGSVDVLDFSDYKGHHRDLIVSLSNAACFNLLCDQINGIAKLKKDFHVFKFGGNNIRTLEPFRKLYGFKIRILDLSNNAISNLNEFQHLNHLSVERLYVTGNECANILIYQQRIHEILPIVAVIDGLDFAGATSAPKKPVKQAKAVFIAGNGRGI